MLLPRFPQGYFSKSENEKAASGCRIADERPERRFQAAISAHAESRFALADLFGTIILDLHCCERGPEKGSMARGFRSRI
jgi:hypothetical protein